MATLESLGKVISTDILVIGGGIAGLASAIAAKEESANLDVLIVEKATTGWAGKAPKGGGVLAVITPEDDPDEFVRFHVNHVGCYLEDQELLSEYARTSLEIVERLGTWGVHLHRNEDGGLKYIKHRGSELPWGLIGVDLDMCLRMRKTAIRLGTKLVDKVSIVDLLKEGDRVVGAIGFNIVDGTCYVIKARAIILANGSQNYRIMPMWSCGRGDGIAAAYRAGAEMRNAEFGSFVNMIFTANRMVAPKAEDLMYNAKGEAISTKYRPHPELESDICSKAVVGWYKEIAAGSGPVYVDIGGGDLNRYSFATQWNAVVAPRPVQAAFSGRLQQIRKGSDTPGLCQGGDCSWLHW